jgi:DNA polymerase III subunit gamma/tau
VSDLALATKYRPKNVSEIIGQDVAVTAVTNAFKSKTLHHAYVFAGKYGCGKTTMARVLAAMENCKKGATLEPCGECENCVPIFAGKSTDVKEMDAASHRGIDDIRAIRDDIRYAPISCRIKYIIIDEAHSLTGQAAEAALKMIEEPPEHVRFILCTTDPHLLKDTIHSRCIMFKFHKVSWHILYEHLQKIATTEGLECDDDALRVAARTADGSVRNALQNLQTMVNYVAGGKVTHDAAKQVLGAIDENLFFHLIDAIINGKAPKAIQVIDMLMRDGRQSTEALEGMYGHLRNLMLNLTCANSIEQFDYTEDEVKRYGHQAKQVGLELTLEMMSLLVDVNRGLIVNVDPQVLLEKYVIDSIVAKRKKDNRKP